MIETHNSELKSNETSNEPEFIIEPETETNKVNTAIVSDDEIED